jgi:hypothetical protein
MRLSFPQTVRLFFRSEMLLPFLLGSVVLGVLGNTAFALLTTLFGTGIVSLLCIFLGAVLTLPVIAAVVVWALGRLVEGRTLPGKSRPARHKGLIFLVSRPEPARHAIDYHLPMLRHCWLFCSEQSRPVAEEVRKAYPLVSFHQVDVRDVHDPLEFTRLVNDVHERLPPDLQPGEVIADYTGMTSHASVGVVLACLGRNRPLQYTPAEYDENRKPIRPLDPIQIDLSPTLIVRPPQNPPPETPAAASSR